MLHASAKKPLRVILGLEPSDPTYVAWWRLWLIVGKQIDTQGNVMEKGNLFVRTTFTVRGRPRAGRRSEA